MLRNILSLGTKAVLGLVLLATPSVALAQRHGGGHGGGGHHGTSSWHGGNNWNHGGGNWNHGYYNSYGYRYPYYNNYGYRYPYWWGLGLGWPSWGGYGYRSGEYYYPNYDNGYYPDYGYDNTYVSAPVEAARINVEVPPDATVLVNGVQMSQTGPVRQYVTPPLEPGYQYNYEIRASWMTPSGPVNNARTVWVNPGDNVMVDLNTAPPARSAPSVQ